MERVLLVFPLKTEARVQYTIEAHQLTSEYTQRPAHGLEPSRRTIEAQTADDAITKFVRQEDSELVSFTRPLRGEESIATVRKDAAVYLVRVYTA
jgi:hypothetical protein